MKEWIGPLDNRKVHPGSWGKHFFKSPEWEAAFPWPLRPSGVLVYILTFIPSSSQKPTPLTEPFRKSVLWHNYTKNSAGALGAGLASAPAITGVCLSGTPASCTRALPLTLPPCSCLVVTESTAPSETSSVAFYCPTSPTMSQSWAQQSILQTVLIRNFLNFKTYFYKI